MLSIGWAINNFDYLLIEGLKKTNLHAGFIIGVKKLGVFEHFGI